MGKAHLDLGKTGEEKGFLYLKGLGYRILETNYKTPLGELDCIAKDHGTIVFVEIKTRQSDTQGLPEESVHHHKRRKVIQSAQCYLKKKHLGEPSVRFDVLSVLIRDGQCQFDLIQNAFEVEE